MSAVAGEQPSPQPSPRGRGEASSARRVRAVLGANHDLAACADGGGGTVAGLCAASGRVFAATAAGVFESTDAGQGWRLLGDGQPLAFAEALTAAPDGVLFACAAGGLHRSEDGGRRWQQVLIGGRMLAVAAAAEGVVIAGSESDGVLRSDDGGRSWTGANAGLLDLTVLALALSPCFERDGVAFVGTPSGVYRSRNAHSRGGRSTPACKTPPCSAWPSRLTSTTIDSSSPARRRTDCLLRTTAARPGIRRWTAA